MKIQKLRLHPFAGTTDRTFSFSDGLNVLSGENEFGKSTLFNALVECLFTNSNLTTAALQKWGSRWFPRPSGDHARVSLEFEAAGSLWHLEKVWGAGQMSLLQEADGIRLADPAGVGDKIRDLLKWNEATWTRVLFTPQAGLAATVGELGKNLLNDIDDLETRLKGLAAIPGDMPSEQLKSLLDAEIKKQNSRWDTATALPEGGKGLGNPWQKEIGLTLQAYYSMEKARKLAEEIRHSEFKLQKLREKVIEINLQRKEDKEFCESGDSISTALSQRQEFETKRDSHSAEQKILSQNLQNWPRLAEQVSNAGAKLENLSQEKEDLQQELKTARLQEKNKAVFDTYDKILKLTKTQEEQSSRISVMPNPSLADILSLEKTEKEKEKTSIQMEALKLRIHLQSSNSIRVQVKKGMEESQSLDLISGSEWNAEAAGRFRLQYENLELSVECGEEDLDALYEKFQKLIDEGKRLQKSLGFEDSGKARLALQDFEAAGRELKSTNEKIEELLQNRTREAWNAWIEENKNLQATRDLQLLEDLHRKKEEDYFQQKAELKQLADGLEDLEKKYESLEALTDKMVDGRARLRELEQNLKNLPLLPEPFRSIPEFIAALNQSRQTLQSYDSALQTAQLEINSLENGIPELSAGEAEAELEFKEKAFRRQQERSLALVRIRKSLDLVLEKREQSDPQSILAESVSSRFRRLSRNSYQSIELGEKQQALGKTALPFQSLSRGTLGSLALAVRLSLGELYLGGMNGMIVLDDPFTDMDAGRRAAAIEEISSFASGHQVLLITCHETHTEEMLSAGAKLTQIS